MAAKTLFLLCGFFLLLVTPANADFFEFLSNAMRFTSRVFGLEGGGESRIDPESNPGRTAERIRALNDAAKYVTEARQRAGRRVLKNRLDRFRSNMNSGKDVEGDPENFLPTSSSAGETDLTSLLGGGDNAAAASSSSSDTDLSSLLGDNVAASASNDGGTSLADLLAESSSGSDKDLEALLTSAGLSQGRSAMNNDRRRALILSRIIKQKLRERMAKH